MKSWSNANGSNSGDDDRDRAVMVGGFDVFSRDKADAVTLGFSKSQQQSVKVWCSPTEKFAVGQRLLSCITVVAALPCGGLDARTGQRTKRLHPKFPSLPFCGVDKTAPSTSDLTQQEGTIIEQQVGHFVGRDCGRSLHQEQECRLGLGSSPEYCRAVGKTAVRLQSFL